MRFKPEIESPLPKRLKEARLRAGISQKKLGIFAGIDEFSASARMNQYEKGKHAPDYAMASRLATLLNVPSSYLYESDDDIAALLVLFHTLNEPEKTLLKDKMKALLHMA